MSTTVQRLVVHFLAERNFPVAFADIPKEQIHDLDILLAQVREKYPATTYEQVLRYVWVRGLDALRAGIASPPDLSKPPRPKGKPLT